MYVSQEPSLLIMKERVGVWGVFPTVSDDRYITESYDGGIRIIMKVYKEWVSENGEPQVFHKTDTERFEVWVI